MIFPRILVGMVTVSTSTTEGPLISELTIEKTKGPALDTGKLANRSA